MKNQQFVCYQTNAYKLELSQVMKNKAFQHIVLCKYVDNKLQNNLYGSNFQTS